MIQKLFIVILILISGTSANAQMFHFGLEAGYANNQVKTESLHSESKNGFMIGGVANYQTKKSFVFESGISFIQKGAKLAGNIYSKENISINEIDAKKMSYININLLIGYKINITNQLSITPKIGGYIGTGVGGYAFVSGKDEERGGYFMSRVNNPFTSSFIQNDDYCLFDNIDSGLQLGIDFQYNKFQLRTSYLLGLNEIQALYDEKLSNRTFNISLAYFIK